MQYNFQRGAVYEKALRKKSVSPNSLLVEDYGFKIDKPICIRSIFTEDDSHLIVPSTLNLGETNEEEEDIQNFIQNSKSLKEKIYEKLSKKGRLKTQNMIKQTTFRPTIKNKKKKQQNSSKCNMTKIASRQSTKKLYPNDMNKSLGKTWADWDIEDDKNQNSHPGMSELSFYERQKQTLQNKKEKQEKGQRIKTETQMNECTFKPKLTKYKAHLR